MVIFSVSSVSTVNKMNNVFVDAHRFVRRHQRPIRQIRWVMWISSSTYFWKMPSKLSPKISFSSWISMWHTFSIYTVCPYPVWLRFSNSCLTFNSYPWMIGWFFWKITWKSLRQFWSFFWTQHLMLNSVWIIPVCTIWTTKSPMLIRYLLISSRMIINYWHFSLLSFSSARVYRPTSRCTMPVPSRINPGNWYSMPTMNTSSYFGVTSWRNRRTMNRKRSWPTRRSSPRSFVYRRLPVKFMT